MRPQRNRARTAQTVIAGAFMLLLAACNTVQGAGRDIESVGRAGEDAID